MKNHIIISLLFLTFSYSKSNSNGGGGLGYGNGRLSFNVVGEIDGKYNLKKQKRDRYFFGMGGNIFGDRTDKNTYDFNEDLFDDKDLGKISESIFIVGGLVLKQSNNIDLYISFCANFQTIIVVTLNGWPIIVFNTRLLPGHHIGYLPDHIC